MNRRGNPVRPTAEGVEPRLLLSTAHHPAPYTGTIRGEFEVVPPSDGGVNIATYLMVKAGGNLTPYGPVSVLYGSALDHVVEFGSIDEFFPLPNDQSLRLDIGSHGKEKVEIELLGPVVPPGTPLRAGHYLATVSTVYPGPLRQLGGGTATLTLPKGLPHHPGQLEPFAIRIVGRS